MADLLQLSPFQQRVLAVPEEVDLFLGGGRGGGKSYTLAVLALRHCEQYRSKSRALYVRQSHAGTQDFETLCLDLYGRVYGKALRWNAQQGIFRFPNGGTLEINQLECHADLNKFQGRSTTLLLVDECGQYPSAELLDRLRGNLRAEPGVPLRTVLAANPGGVGHAWLSKRYVFPAKAWTLTEDKLTGRLFVHAPSLATDNPFIDAAAYLRNLRAACVGDPELYEAWAEGSWTVNRGAFFASCLDYERNATDAWRELPRDRGDVWERWLAHDFGSAAPSCTFLVLKSPGDFGPDKRYYARGSFVLVDELATNVPGELNRGMGYTVPLLAEHIKDMCQRWGVKPRGVADDSIFAHTGSGAGSISEEFVREGVLFVPARKGDRISGWQQMRRLLADAGSPDLPGLYISSLCEYAWQTLPFLARDPRRIEDVDSRQADHAADAIRYGINYRKRVARQEDMYT